MSLSNFCRWCSLKSWSADWSSGPPEANATWQSPRKGAGLSHSSMHVPPDFLSHPAGHLHAHDGWHDGGRWPHSTRGEFPSHFHNMFSSSCSISIICLRLSENGWPKHIFPPFCQVSILGDPPKDVNLPQSAFLNANNVFPSGKVLVCNAWFCFSYFAVYSSLLHQVRYSGK